MLAIRRQVRMCVRALVLCHVSEGDIVRVSTSSRGGNLCQSFPAHSFTPTCPRPPQWLSDCTCRVTALAFGEVLHSACDCSSVTWCGFSNRKSVTVSTARAGGDLPWIFCRHGARDSGSGPQPPAPKLCSLDSGPMSKTLAAHGRVQSGRALVSKR